MSSNNKRIRLSRWIALYFKQFDTVPPMKIVPLLICCCNKGTLMLSLFRARELYESLMHPLVAVS